ncbi:hypothetical protein CLV42_101679 [Chitinophaga ginsengisoli]|uniref:Uncharacterized protein n=1 Tax=Chitinophaga ginsengisoli TaxID=363837 RepID=A0A2P8GPP3_9BACT|nr:hypothetical protein CLV42_101679 [Chitinophaga ginsengisoli]
MDLRTDVDNGILSGACYGRNKTNYAKNNSYFTLLIQIKKA